MKLNNTSLCFVRILLLAWVVIFYLSNNIAAQTPADFQQYKDRYPSHPYISLQDNTELEIMLDKHGKPVFKIKETSKVLVLTDNCDGLSELRNYYNSNDEILKTEAYSLVPTDGKYRKITIPAMKKTTDRGNNYYFDDSYCMVGHFPAIAKGTILYNYNEYLSHESALGYNFYFGQSSPVETTAIVITVPDYIQLVCRYAGKDTALINYSATKKGNMTTHSWRCERLKGYFEDQLAPTIRYFRPHLTINIAGYDYKGKHTNIMGTLDDICKWEFEKLKNTNLIASPIVRQLADSITQGSTTSEEKVKAIFRWVQDKIKYVAIEDGDNGFVPQNATTVIARRYGDCKDKSSLITALLQSVGEKSSLACVGTRLLPYTFTRYPMVLTANHLIAIWWDANNRPVPLDGTSRYLSINDVPASIQGKECLIVKGENDCMVYKIPVDTPERNIKVDTLDLKIDNKRLYGSGLVLLKGEDKSELMYRIDGKNELQQKDLICDYLDFAGNKLEIKQFSFEGLTDPEQQLKLQYEISLPDYCVVSGERFYVNMSLYQHLTNIDLKNDRSIPLEAERVFTHRITTKIEIPDGYSYTGLPEKSEYKHPLFGFTISYELQGKNIVQNTNIRIGFQVIDNEELAAFGEMIQSLKKAYRKTVMFQKKAL